MVIQSEIGNASQVRAYGDGLVQGTTFNNSSFIVDTRDAGQYASLKHLVTVSLLILQENLSLSAFCVAFVVQRS